jgi:hypothetical protein
MKLIDMAAMLYDLLRTRQGQIYMYPNLIQYHFV